MDDGRGAMTRDEIRDFKPCIRDGIMAEIEVKGAGWFGPDATLVVDVNDYEPAEGEQWDVDKWEERSGHIYAPATRENWILAYRIARGLLKGPVTVKHRTGDMTLTMPVDITISNS